MDEGCGLYFMTSRYYHAALGRFLQKDPIGPEGGTNPYAYASNNPASLVDPRGFQGNAFGDWKTWAGLGLIGLGGVMMALPSAGITQIGGVSVIKIGAGLMGTGAAVDIYSLATSTGDVDKAKNARFEEIKNLLQQDANGNWVLPKDDEVFDTLYPQGSNNRASLEELAQWKNKQPKPASCSAPGK
jgi:uncharacterized protein RhaS with RHS repeats